MKENEKLTFSSGKRWVMSRSINGNLQIEYKINDKVYVITRTDGMPFDGVSENVGAEFYGNMKAPENLNEVVEYEVNSFSSMQIEPEVSRFTEFDWAFNEDMTQIIVTPVFLEKSTNIVINSEGLTGPVELSFGSVKRVRNGGMFLSLKYKKNR